MDKKVQGIIIRAIDYKETSRIITLLTEEGFITFLLKGANQYKSPYKLIKEAVSEVNIMYSFHEKREMYTVVTADLLNDFSLIKKNYLKYEIVFSYIHLLNKIGDMEEKFKREIYKLFRSNLLCLNRTQEITKDLFYKNVFLIKCWYFLGIKPNFKECQFCGHTKIAGFNLNGAVCAAHQGLTDLNSDAYKLIYFMYKFDFVEDDLSSVNFELIPQVDLFVKNYNLMY